MTRKNKILDNKLYTFAYIPGNSFMHKLNPISKIFFLIILTFSTFLIKSLIFLTLIFLSLIILALMSNISLKNLILKLKFIFFILIFSILLNIFFNAIPDQNDEVLFYLFNLPFLKIRRLAVYFALKAFFIILILYTSTIIFTYTTKMKDFVYSLMRLKIPYRYCFAFMVAVRNIPLIQQDARTIALAQKARGFDSEKVNTIKKVYFLIFERLIATIVSTLRRTNTTSISMENRCFGIYKKRTNLIKINFRRLDVFFLIIFSCLFLLLILYILEIIPIPHFPSLYSFFLRYF